MPRKYPSPEMQNNYPTDSRPSRSLMSFFQMLEIIENSGPPGLYRCWWTGKHMQVYPPTRDATILPRQNASAVVDFMRYSFPKLIDNIEKFRQSYIDTYRSTQGFPTVRFDIKPWGTLSDPSLHIDVVVAGGMPRASFAHMFEMIARERVWLRDVVGNLRWYIKHVSKDDVRKGTQAWVIN